MGVVITVQRVDGGAYAADEQHGLLAADAVFPRHPSQRGVDLCQSVRPTASG